MDNNDQGTGELQYLQDHKLLTLSWVVILPDWD